MRSMARALWVYWTQGACIRAAIHHLGKLDDRLVVRLLPLLVEGVPLRFTQAVQPVGNVQLWGDIQAGYLCLGFI